MAGEWSSTTLGAIATKDGYGLVDGPFGSNLPASCYTASGVPLIRGSNLSLGTTRFRDHEFVFVSQETAKQTERSLCRPDDIVFTKKGTIGQTGLVPTGGKFDLFLLSSNQMKLTVNRDIADPLFVYYYVSSPASVEKVVRDSEATGVPKTNVAYFRDFPINLPPLAEQRAIASVLGALDDKIELNRRMNATLESMARALFQSWFIDFDPVRAKLDNRHPTGMDAETAALFPDSFEHGIDGEILPKGWIKTTVGVEVLFQTGFSFQSEFFTETPPGIRLARGMNVKEGEFFWSNQSRYWPQVTPDIEQYLLEVGDVLIGMDGSKVGKNWVRVRAADLPCLLVQRVARLREANSIGQNFIALLVGSTTFRDFVEAVKTGTTIPHISGGQIKGYSFTRPPCDDNRIFQRFESLVGPMTAQADKNHAEAEILSNLRDTLLPKLLSGDLSVAGLESKLEIPS